MQIFKQKPEEHGIRYYDGNVIFSFGGATACKSGYNATLAQRANSAGYSAQKLAELYENIVKAYNQEGVYPMWFDFDVEGYAVNDTDANTLRNEALAILQKDYPDLKAVVQSGNIPAIDILENAIKNNVKIYTVNLMAMDYGVKGDIGSLIQSSVSSAIANIAALKWTPTSLKPEVGITPMIIQDDTGGLFNTSDADSLLDFADGNKNINFLSFWYMGKDISDNWAFTNIFKTYTP